MNVVGRFSEKASEYRRFRWQYAAEAIGTVIGECGLTNESIVADIGSGTGMLAGQFSGRVGTVHAVEPSEEMRAIAARETAGRFRSIDGRSDATTLPDHSVDLITAGRALHWFPHHSTRLEFERILKPNGYLAVFSVPCANRFIVDALKSIKTEEYGWGISAEEIRKQRVPLSFYFGHEKFRSFSFPAEVHENWDEFLGRVLSFSPAPGANHPLRPKLERALRDIFDDHATGGVLKLPISTDVSLARIGGRRT